MIRKLLIVEDEDLLANSLVKTFHAEGYDARRVASAEDGISLFEKEKYPVVLLDMRLPDMSGNEFMKNIKKKYPETVFIVMTAFADVESAVETMKLGASDYMQKPFNIEDARYIIKNAFDNLTLKEQANYRAEDDAKKFSFESIVQESMAMKEIIKIARKITDTKDTTVLIEGETGAGKELVAKAIHYNGARAKYPFVEINCAAVPETLLESELFGHEAGAYTDAKKQSKGLVELADGGTLFLDEIGDMELNMQAKLLRFIETKKFRRIGGRTDNSVDLRLIAATNKNLEEEVGRGNFREDLYYRLKVVDVKVPSLRERREDVQKLVDTFIAGFNSEMRRSVKGVSASALKVLKEYDWPGNVRELRNMIERIMLLEDTDVIGVEHLPVDVRNGKALVSDALKPDRQGKGQLMGLEDMEKEAIISALKSSGNNQSETAKKLGIGRYALRYKMRKYGLL